MTLSPAPARSNHRTDGAPGAPGFTLIEVLVVVAIIALLIGILMPTLGSARKAALLATEQADARAIAGAYTAFAVDNKNYLLPAKIDSNKFPEAVRRAPSVLPTGDAPSGADAVRWIWRLGPYMDFSYPTLIRDKAVLAQANGLDGVADFETGSYRASVFTGFGLNSYYIGGRKEFYETNAQGVNRFQASFGSDFFVNRLDRASRPAQLISFVSSASNIQTEGFRDGYFYVEPPRTMIEQPTWRITENGPPTRAIVERQAGWYGAFPIAKGKTVVNFLDGHAEQLVWDDLRDMRRWSPQADSPEWMLPRPSGN
jgi:prepilin-type N-terminal cleavage/methylation domain-containing protein